MSDAIRKAEEFLKRERAFRLGELVTESSHPKTKNLSQTAARDVPAAIRLLQSVDQDIPPAMKKAFEHDSFGRLVEAFCQALLTGKRIYFTGCGATGRLSILLEAAWRRFWRGRQLADVARASCPCSPPLARCQRDARPRRPRHNRKPVPSEVEGSKISLEDRIYSVMAGGDFALIKSVEGYEDFPDFGRRQLRERGVAAGDVVVAITEGGETPFVIGTAWEGLDAGANVFFVYNNPTEVLRRHVRRSREVIDEPRITKLDLTTGPMAITGSTRMQATTAELLVVGAALETALVRFLQERSFAGAQDACARRPGTTPDRVLGDYHRIFCELLEQLSRPEAIDALARATIFEESIYRQKGLLTYAADSFLLDVLTDTTERSPTFMLPAFRRAGDHLSARSWAFVKDPLRGTQDAWHALLHREPRGLSWGREVYEALNAPANLKAQPPKLDNAEIYKFMVGNELDPSRTDAPDSALVAVGVSGEAEDLIRAARNRFGSQYRKTTALVVGSSETCVATDEAFCFPCRLADSPLQLWHHLAVKLILNTLSTATMARCGRVIGNAMVWLSPSNKKLIDRGSRLIAQQAACTYEQACIALHEAIEEVGSAQRMGREVPSPVALAIERLTSKQDQSR